LKKKVRLGTERVAKRVKKTREDLTSGRNVFYLDNQGKVNVLLRKGPRTKKRIHEGRKAEKKRKNPERPSSIMGAGDGERSNILSGTKSDEQWQSPGGENRT